LHGFEEQLRQLQVDFPDTDQEDRPEAQSLHGNHSTNNSIDSLPAGNAELLFDLEGFIIDRICYIEDRKNNINPGQLAENIRYAFNLEIAESGISTFSEFCNRQYRLSAQRDPNWTRTQLSSPEADSRDDLGNSSLMNSGMAMPAPLKSHPIPRSQPLTGGTFTQSYHDSVGEWEDVPLTPETNSCGISDPVVRPIASGDCRSAITTDTSNNKVDHTTYYLKDTDGAGNVPSQRHDYCCEGKKKTRTRRLLEKLTPAGLRRRSGGGKQNMSPLSIYSLERMPPKIIVTGKENDPKQPVMQMRNTGKDLQSHLIAQHGTDLHEPTTTEPINFNDEKFSFKIQGNSRNNWRKSFQKSLRGLQSKSRLRLIDHADEESYFGKRSTSGKVDSVVDDDFQTIRASSMPFPVHKKASSQAFSIQPTPPSKYCIDGESSSGMIPPSLPENVMDDFANNDDSVSLYSFDQCDNTKLPPIPRSSSSESEMRPRSKHQERKHFRDTSWGRKTQRALGGVVGAYAEDSVNHSSPIECAQSADRHILFINQKHRTRRVASENMLTSAYARVRGDDTISQSQAAKSVDNLALVLEKDPPMLPINPYQLREQQFNNTKAYQGQGECQHLLSDAELRIAFDSNNRAIVHQDQPDDFAERLSNGLTPDQDMAPLPHHVVGNAMFDGNLIIRGRYRRSNSSSKVSEASVEEHDEGTESLRTMRRHSEVEENNSDGYDASDEASHVISSEQ